MNRRAYIITHEAWYGSTALDDEIPQRITVMKTAGNTDSGGVEWEFGLEWHDLRDGEGLSLRVCVFFDAFDAFTEELSFFAHLRELGPMPACDVVISLLDELGFVDVTERERVGPRTDDYVVDGAG